jgi:glucan phosphoethanolaminetransferase (alkaline phosphatase superfamily)
MKNIFTWHSLRIFIIFYFCVLGFNVLITVIDSDFDLATQVSTKNLLFNIIMAAFLTLIRIAKQDQPQHQDTKA